MKSSITKIGNLALGRIYGNKFDAKTEYERTFTVSKDEFNLTIFADANYTKDRWHGHYTSGVSYEVWGITLGLKPIPNDSAIIFDVITDTLKGSKEVPSHFIVKHWSDYHDRKKESYTVYRLTQSQEKQILKAGQSPHSN